MLLSVLGDLTAKPIENEERMMLRKRMDSESSASSYVYRSDNQGPPHFYYLSSEDLNRNFHIQPSAAPLVYYKSSPFVTYAPAFPSNYYPSKTKSSLIAFKPSPPDTSKSSSASSSSEESNESGRDDSKAKHSNESEDHSSEGGQSHEDKYHKKKGNKSSKGYSNEIKFKKGKKGSYEKEYKDKDHEEEGENDSKKYHEADNYHQHEAQGEHKKGGKYGSKKHHKKGSKSKGYHNVFMKDEYKKDHTFYGKESLTFRLEFIILFRIFYFQIPPTTKAITQSTVQITRNTRMMMAKIKKVHTMTRPTNVEIIPKRVEAIAATMKMTMKVTRRNRVTLKNIPITKNMQKKEKKIIILSMKINSFLCYFKV